MKHRTILATIVGVIIFTFCVGFAIVDFPKGKTVYIKNTENFRDKPQGTKIGVLEKGTAMVVLEDSPKWLKVKVEGWVWKESVTDNRLAATGGGYRAFQIVVKQLSTAEDILAQLKGGANFEELAKGKSIGPAAKRGGDLGYFQKGDFQAEIEAAILALRPGAISEIVKSRAGYHIFKRVE